MKANNVRIIPNLNDLLLDMYCIDGSIENIYFWLHWLIELTGLANDTGMPETQNLRNTFFSNLSNIIHVPIPKKNVFRKIEVGIYFHVEKM